jgi:hypothetical protein
MCSICEEKVKRLLGLFCLSIILGIILLCKGYTYIGIFFIFLPIIHIFIKYILWKNKIYF